MSEEYPDGPLAPEELERAWKASQNYWEGQLPQDRPETTKEWFFKFAQLREIVKGKSEGLTMALAKGKKNEAVLWVKLNSSPDPNAFWPIVEFLTTTMTHLLPKPPLTLKGRPVGEKVILILDLIREGRNTCKAVKKGLSDVGIDTTPSAIGHAVTILSHMGFVRRITKTEDGRITTRYEEAIDAETTQE